MTRALVLGICWIGLSGCATRVTMNRDQLLPGTELARGRVETSDGLEYRFERVEITPDSLIGQYRILVEREEPGSEMYYDEVRKRRVFPLQEVERVTTSERDPSRTFLAGAGIAAAAFFVRDLTSGDDGTRGRSGAPQKGDPRR